MSKAEKAASDSATKDTAAPRPLAARRKLGKGLGALMGEMQAGRTACRTRP